MYRRDKRCVGNQAGYVQERQKMCEVGGWLCTGETKGVVWSASLAMFNAVAKMHLPVPCLRADKDVGKG